MISIWLFTISFITLNSVAAVNCWLYFGTLVCLKLKLQSVSHTTRVWLITALNHIWPCLRTKDRNFKTKPVVAVGISFRANKQPGTQLAHYTLGRRKSSIRSWVWVWRWWAASYKMRKSESEHVFNAKVRCERFCILCILSQSFALSQYAKNAWVHKRRT